MEFIENVKKEIKKQGITKTELGRNTEISEGTIRSWEKGKQPSLYTFPTQAYIVFVCTPSVYSFKP